MSIRASRIRTGRWLALPVAAALLAGCSAGSGDDAEVAGDPNDAADDAGAAGEVTADDGPAGTAGDPVVITHRHGETEVPADPERVVAVGFNDADVVLSLGIVPVGERSLLGGLDASARPWFVEELDGAATGLARGRGARRRAGRRPRAGPDPRPVLGDDRGRVRHLVRDRPDRGAARGVHRLRGAVA